MINKSLSPANPSLCYNELEKMIKEKIVIKEKLSGKRIDKVCAERFPEFSRTEWQKRGSFMRNGTVTTGKTKVQVGEEWEVCCEDAPLVSDEILPWKFDLKVLKDSKSWLVIEKPEGVSVHPSLSEGSQETIVNALVNLFGKNLSENYDEIDGRKVARPGLVHRLDKITSGVLLVAKTNTTHRILQENWKDVEKIYVAVVHGCPPKKGKIEAGLARDFRDRKKMAVSSDERARQATTEFERIEFNKQKNLSLLKVKILTGRTHQIRVHLSSIGFPILGDEKYGGKKAERVFLHAKSLSFPNPDDKNKKEVVISEMPAIFKLS